MEGESMESITIGSKEDLVVDITDVLENVTDLTATNPRYDVKDKASSFKMNNQVAVVDPINKMRLICLIDTTLGGNWVADHYFLYVRFTNAPEAPQIGPLEFKVNP
jgi:hypothetical protein